jgi:hypothetical protein
VSGYGISVTVSAAAPKGGSANTEVEKGSAPGENPGASLKKPPTIYFLSKHTLSDAKIQKLTKTLQKKYIKLGQKRTTLNHNITPKQQYHTQSKQAYIYMYRAPDL